MFAFKDLLSEDYDEFDELDQEDQQRQLEAYALRQGWTVAKYLLGHERLNTGRIGQSRRELLRVRELAAHTLARGKPQQGQHVGQRARIWRDDISHHEQSVGFEQAAEQRELGIKLVGFHVLSDRVQHDQVDRSIEHRRDIFRRHHCDLAAAGIKGLQPRPDVGSSIRKDELVCALRDPLRGLLPDLLKTWLRVRGVVSFEIP